MADDRYFHEDRAVHTVLMALLIALEDSGQSMIVEKTFDLAGETIAATALSKDESLRTNAAPILQVLDHMRKTVIRHQAPRKTV